MKKLSVGSKVFVERKFSKDEVLVYLNLSGDSNPIHFDEEYAKKTIFKTCIVPGIMVGSLFGGLLGSELPGENTIHLGQTMNFLKPIFINEIIRSEIEIIDIRNDKPIITFQTRCFKNNGEIAITGKAVVKHEVF